MRLVALFLLLASRLLAAEPIPATARSHSHNDYARPRPLLDALAAGTGSVEADVYPIGGDLLVAHNREDTTPARTLRTLYLEPLARHVAAHAGRVHPAGPPLILLIDIKADPETVYALLAAQLAPHAAWLTRWRDGRAIPGAVTVLLSGARPRATITAQTDRLVALDGTLDDLAQDPPLALVPLVSENWTKLFLWRGTGPFPATDREKLAALVARAHAQHRLLRLWAAPDTPESWAEQYAAGVDLLNTDTPAALRAFLLAAPAP